MEIPDTERDMPAAAQSEHTAPVAVETETQAESPPVVAAPNAAPPIVVPTRRGLSASARLVLYALAAVVGVWLAIMLRDILLQVLIATILAAGITPITHQLTRIGLPRGLSVILIYLLLILAFIGLGFLLVPPVVAEVQSLVRQAPDFGARFVRSLDALQQQFPFLPPLGPALASQLQQLGNSAGAIFVQALNIIGVALGVFGGLLTAILTLLVTFYLVVDGQRIRDYLLSFLPAGQRPRAGRVADTIGQRMGGWLLGQIALSTSIGVASFVALLLIGVNNALLLAVVAAVAELLPIIGPWIAAVPAVIVAFTQDPVKALLTIVAYIVIQQLESNLLAPRIMGRAVRLHPLAVILALLAGASLFGIVGALVAVPVASALSVILDEVRASRNGVPAAEMAKDTPSGE